MIEKKKLKFSLDHLFKYRIDINSKKGQFRIKKRVQYDEEKTSSSKEGR